MSDSKGTEEVIVERGKTDKIVIPEGMSLPDAQRYLRQKEEEEETYVSVSETVNAFPLDGAVAFYEVLRRRYGWTNLVPTPGMFGTKYPPQIIGVPIGFEETKQVPWGRCEVPNIEGFLNTGFAQNDVGLPLFQIGGSVKRKHERVISAIAKEVREEVRKNSIYKGKAVRINFRDTDGERMYDFQPTFSPIFLDMEKHSKQILVYSSETELCVQTNLLNPVQHTDRCRKVGIPLRRGILLAGTYGTGKTLTGYQLAQVCVENGWTFIYLEDVRDVDLALAFARLYMPCVLFAEDVDRCMAGPRSPEMDKVLNTIDGIMSKDTEIMSVFTTNYRHAINPAFIRPGRIDTIVPVGPPDEGAIIKLIRAYGTQDSECEVVATDEEILEALKDINKANAAFYREAVERAKLSAINHNGEGESVLKINKDDLLAACLTMKDHVKQLQPEVGQPEEGDWEAVDPMRMVLDVMTDTFAGAFLHKLANPKFLEKIMVKKGVGNPLAGRPGSQFFKP